MRTLPLAVENDAVAEFAVVNPLAESYAEIGSGRNARRAAT
jgi:hypothetical protein